MSRCDGMPVGDYRRQLYRRNRIPDDFEDIVADHRSIGRTDDDIALTFGISVEALHKRFRDRGIPPGRRWRGIEEAACGNAMTKDEVRRIAVDDGAPVFMPPKRRAS